MSEHANEMAYGSDEHLDGLSRDGLKSEVRWWWGRASEMESENAKLRERTNTLEELCVQMFNCCHGGCKRCKIVDKCAEAGGDRCILWFHLEDQMHELGIDVDE